MWVVLYFLLAGSHVLSHATINSKWVDEILKPTRKKSMTNRGWVLLHRHNSTHLITNRKWVMHSSLPSRFISSHCLTIRMWVILLKLWQAIGKISFCCFWQTQFVSDLFPCLALPILLLSACELHGTFSYPAVSIYLFCSNNRKWVAIYLEFCNVHSWIQRVGGAFSCQVLYTILILFSFDRKWVDIPFFHVMLSL